MALALVLKRGQLGEPVDLGLVVGGVARLLRWRFGGLKRWRVYGEPL